MDDTPGDRIPLHEVQPDERRLRSRIGHDGGRNILGQKDGGYDIFVMSRPLILYQMVHAAQTVVEQMGAV